MKAVIEAAVNESSSVNRIGSAAVKLKPSLEGKRVVSVMTGGNLDAAKLRWVIAGERAPS